MAAEARRDPGRPQRVGEEVGGLRLYPDPNGCMRPGLATLCAKLDPDAEIALEATGGYERRAVETLTAQGRRVRLLNPARVRRFAEATGQLAKTDRIDAKCIAAFACLVDTPPVRDDPARRRLADLRRARTALVRQKIALTNRLDRLCEEMRPVIAALQASFAKAIAALDATIRQAIAEHAQLAQRAALIASVPGIGAILTTLLVADFPELGLIPDAKAVALAGLAPHPRQSGSKDKPRHIRGGRPQLTQAFYLAALCAVRHKDPHFWPIYNRLLQAGKPPKLALIAIARRILIATAAVLRRQTPWQTRLTS